MTEDIVRPKALVIPIATTTVRDTMVAEVGTLLWNTTTGSLNICITKAAGAGNWKAIMEA